jgi:myo-inositol-1(or 4)-monophosphatase
LPDADAGRPDAAPDAPAAARDLALLAATVREAGELALRMFGTSLRTWTKGVSSPVSEADIAVNDLILQRIRAADPEAGLLSEESADDAGRLTRRRVWVVDPIDGTRSYLAGRDDWTVSVALVAGGRPVVAAVFAPVTDELFLAAQGRGAAINAVPIHAAGGASLDIRRMAGPRALIERLGAPSPEAQTHPRIGSLALRICRVADGRIDAAFATGNSRDWDLAAADLIVQEAGGRLTSLAGQPLVYNRPSVTHGELAAAGRDRHAVIVRRLREFSGN